MQLEVAIPAQAARSPLTLELDGGQSPPVRIPIPLPPPSDGAPSDVTIAVSPPEGFELSVESRLDVRLLTGNRLLDRVTIPIAIQDPHEFLDPQLTFNPDSRRLTARISRVRDSDSTQPFDVRLEGDGLTLEDGVLAARIGPEQDAVTLETVLPLNAQRRDWETFLTVGGVPRCFAWTVSRTSATPARHQPFELYVVAHASGTAFLTQTAFRSIPLQLVADGPWQTQVYAGIDLDDDGRLDVRERRIGRRLWRGRDVRVNVTGSVEPGVFQIGSTVSDVVLNMSAIGLSGTPTVLVELLAANQTITRRIPVALVNAAPVIEFVTPLAGSAHPPGEPIAVTVRSPSRAWQSISRVEFAADKNGNGLWDDDETLIPVDLPAGQPLRFQNSNQLAVRLKTDSMLPPETILIRTPDAATSQLEHAGGARSRVPVTLLARAVTPATVPGVIVPAAAAGPEPAASPEPATRTVSKELQSEPVRRQIMLDPDAVIPVPPGTVTGQVVTIDGRPRRGVRVSITGVGTVLTDPNGRFRLPGVQPGVQQVSAVDGPRTGTVRVKVLSEKESAVTLHVVLK